METLHRKINKFYPLLPSIFDEIYTIDFSSHPSHSMLEAELYTVLDVWILEESDKLTSDIVKINEFLSEISSWYIKLSDIFLKTHVLYELLARISYHVAKIDLDVSKYINSCLRQLNESLPEDMLTVTAPDRLPVTDSSNIVMYIKQICCLCRALRDTMKRPLDNLITTVTIVAPPGKFNEEYYKYDKIVSVDAGILNILHSTDQKICFETIATPNYINLRMRLGKKAMRVEKRLASIEYPSAVPVELVIEGSVVLPSDVTLRSTLRKNTQSKVYIGSESGVCLMGLTESTKATADYYNMITLSKKIIDCIQKTRERYYIVTISRTTPQYIKCYGDNIKEIETTFDISIALKLVDHQLKECVEVEGISSV